MNRFVVLKVGHAYIDIMGEFPTFELAADEARQVKERIRISDLLVMIHEIGPGYNLYHSEFDFAI